MRRSARGATPAANPAPALRRLEILCRERGQRLTRQRRAVVRQLLAAGRPLSAYELLERLLPEDGCATAASVYRTLEFLIGLGVVHRLESKRSFVLCRHPQAPHRVQFLICRGCGEVVEAEDPRIAAAAARLGDRLGFALDQGIVELTGLCGHCRAGGAHS
jgi:Fur family zinc uptake transcriptional regulator